MPLRPPQPLNQNSSGAFSPGNFWLLVIGFLFIPVAVYFGSEAASGNMRLPLMLTITGVGLFLLFGIPQYLWVLAAATIFLPGSIPGLPIPFSPFEIFTAVLLVRFVVDQVIFRKQGITFGYMPDSLLLILFLTVLLYHGIQDRFAMRMFGSNIWGGRAYFGIGIALLVYFAVQSSPLKLSAFRHLPTIILAVGSIDFAIKLITQIAPGLGGALFFFYSDVSMSDPSMGAMGSRWGFLGNYGYLLILWAASYYRVQDFFLRGALIPGFILTLGFGLTTLSGYRSAIATGLLLLIIVFFRDLRWKGVFTLIPLGIFALAVAVVLQLAVGLPPVIQRGLTFIPIEWDAATAADAQGSLDFRKQVAEEWQETIFPRHPFFGRGFGLHMDDMMATLPFLSMDGYLSPTMTRNEAFAIGGHLHHGLRSVVDRFGIVGGILFLIWIGALLRRAYNYLKYSREEPLNPPLQWLTIYLIAFTILYLPGALRIESFLPQQLFLVGLFYALSRASGIDLAQKDKNPAKSIVPAFEVPLEDQPRPRFQPRRLRGQP